MPHAQHWLVLCLIAACGDNHLVDPPLTPDATVPLVATCDEATLPATLAAVSGVSAVAEASCGDAVSGAARCFVITFDQAIRHAEPASPRFPQHLFLIHRGCDRPTLVADWGYAQETFFDDELSVLYGANALWIEHRFQGPSRPGPGAWDWSALTITNGATDMHEIVGALREHYGGHFVSTGASKGGITATYHRYLFPADLDGSIPYVAPASRETIDPRYQDYLAASLPAPCAPALRDAQVAALTTRRAMMLQQLGALTGPGTETLFLEYMIARFDWAFWQYYGVGYCSRVPTPATSDAAFWSFFAELSGFAGGASPDGSLPDLSPEEEQQRMYGALDYEWLTEQGFALQIGAHLAPYLQEPYILMTMEDSFRESFPDVELPAYDGTITAAARTWVREQATDVLLIYGQYDPWSGGALDEPLQASSARYFVPNATHGAQLVKLPTSERIAALAHATRMFGNPPVTAAHDAAARAGARRDAILAAHEQRANATRARTLLRR